jgi:TorA maturation chaperone TorD
MSELQSEMSTVAFRTYVAAEDHARANFYALIARLFAAPPDLSLLKAIASSPPLATEDEGAPLPMAWSKLIAASTVIDAEAAQEEYDALFGGVGKSLVNLHASHHLTGFMMEKPLAELRETLKRLGIARLDKQTVVEDHVSAVCETMRLLIVGGGDGSTLKPQSTTVQRDFFEQHVNGWTEKLCTAIAKQSLANYFAVVAQFGSAFFSVERDSFAI